VVPLARFLVGECVVELRYGELHARRRYLQALTAPATKPVYQACCLPTERAITSSRLCHSLSLLLYSLEHHSRANGHPRAPILFALLRIRVTEQATKAPPCCARKTRKPAHSVYPIRMPYQQFADFMKNRMRMSRVYQPVMVVALLRGNDLRDAT
jgi:hypothetical protein